MMAKKLTDVEARGSLFIKVLLERYFRPYAPSFADAYEDARLIVGHKNLPPLGKSRAAKLLLEAADFNMHRRGPIGSTQAQGAKEAA